MAHRQQQGLSCRESKNIDRVRGPINEGGLYAERLGWFLLDFNVPGRKSNTSSQLDGISESGVRFYTTTFYLNIDNDLDAPIRVSLSSLNGTVAHTKFPNPPGIINNHGQNTLALSLWAQTDEVVQFDGVELFTYGLYQTDFEFNRDWSY
ncbi:uncharacterized protein N7473_007461 [Penicillium subrubescens]|uniref:uncharacterized protein n=1 Tax=Penicillium subrubescens TaxID=1316194 RepID=UPI002545ACCF|nr:uncharacterized protein N7473_007461 [Penicillium subrubescens]KAJ5891233.1 hypothetical protein N7473_007461 [Penicillium subrubescens]